MLIARACNNAEHNSSTVNFPPCPPRQALPEGTTRQVKQLYVMMPSVLQHLSYLHKIWDKNHVKANTFGDKTYHEGDGPFAVRSSMAWLANPSAV